MAGILARVPLPEHAGRFEYALTEKGRDFSPTYLALKKWGDDWLAEPAGPQVVFTERRTGREIKYPELPTARGKPLALEDVEIVAGTAVVPFNRKRFGSFPDLESRSKAKRSGTGSGRKAHGASLRKST